jgi:hypothetical protein
MGRILNIFFPILGSGFCALLLAFGIRPFENFCQNINIKNQIKSSPLLSECNFVIFDESGIKGKTSISSSETNWEAFVKAYETEKDFFFFTSNKLAVFIPKHAFISDEQINQLRELTKTKLGDRAKFSDTSS